MKQYMMPAQQIPLYDGYDVLVIGRGRGCTAAIASTREEAHCCWSRPVHWAAWEPAACPGLVPILG